MKNKKETGKADYSKYLFAGVVIAVLILIIFSLSEKNEIPPVIKNEHVWSTETDSLFVKNCYNKYKPQIKDDMVKQETMKAFCRCMLEKVKSKYDEKDISKVLDSDIKLWDDECRKQISNSNLFK